MNIVGQKIILRAIEKQDIPLLLKWSNSPEIQYNLGDWHFPLSSNFIEKWIDNFSFDSTDQRFIIYHEKEGPIGLANLVKINWKDRNAFHGILIGDQKYRGQGYGQDTVLSIMRYAFEELNLERLDTTIIEHNEASLKLYIKKCGWIEEGRKENTFFRQNRFWSNIILGITRERWQKVKDTLTVA